MNSSGECTDPNCNCQRERGTVPVHQKGCCEKCRAVEIVPLEYKKQICANPQCKCHQNATPHGDGIVFSEETGQEIERLFEKATPKERERLNTMLAENDIHLGYKYQALEAFIADERRRATLEERARIEKLIESSWGTVTATFVNETTTSESPKRLTRN